MWPEGGHAWPGGVGGRGAEGHAWQAGHEWQGRTWQVGHVWWGMVRGGTHVPPIV